MDVIEWKPLVSTLIYSIVGMGVLGLGFLAVRAVSPFSIRKEIEEDQNTALAIIIGSVFIALALIISASISS